MIVNELFNAVPFPIIKFVYYKFGVPKFIRYNKLFWNTYNFLENSQWWNKKKLEEYQLKQLKKLLYNAYENVPYYNRIFKENNFSHKDVNGVEDLNSIPYLEKDIFKQHFNEIISQKFNIKNMPLNHTAGTTGKPLQFYQTYSENQIEWAYICHQWSRVGYRPGDSRVELRGALIKENPPIEYRPFDNLLRLSPFIRDKDVVNLYIDKIKSFGARFLCGYPAAIATFASMIKRFNIDITFRLTAVLFASEAIYDWEREIVREVFNCRVFSHYGLTEHVVIAAECENSHNYHCLPQYGVTEIDPVNKEIIATGFINNVNPFIRYRTGDVVLGSIYNQCEYCGRNYFPVFKKVEGRLFDFIITPKGEIIYPTGLLVNTFKDLKTIKNTQLVQTAVDHIVIRVSTFKGASDKNDKELRQICIGLKEVLGTEMRIEVEIVDEIEISSSGKFKWIKSEISRNFIEKGIYDFLINI